jgi:hypothetical protein
MRLRFAAAFVLLTSPAFAQAWIEYVNKDDLFTVNFPGQPKVESFIWQSDYDRKMPAKRYTAERDGATYRVTVVDYGSKDNPGERQGTELRGAVDYASTLIRRTGTTTFDSYQEINVIPGHALHVTLPDGKRNFAQINYHAYRLYIVEAIVPAGMPPPDQFVASIAMIDKDGNTLRYADGGISFPDGRQLAGRGGGGGGGAAGAPAGGGRGGQGGQAGQ